MLEKARALACDVVVLDLEDAVAPEHKGEARDAACAVLRSFGGREPHLQIRVGVADGVDVHHRHRRARRNPCPVGVHQLRV